MVLRTNEFFGSFDNREKYHLNKEQSKVIATTRVQFLQENKSQGRTLVLIVD